MCQAIFGTVPSFQESQGGPTGTGRKGRGPNRHRRRSAWMGLCGVLSPGTEASQAALMASLEARKAARTFEKGGEDSSTCSGIPAACQAARAAYLTAQVAGPAVEGW